MSKEIPRQKIDSCEKCPNLEYPDYPMPSKVVCIKTNTEIHLEAADFPNDCQLKDWQEPQPVQRLDKPDSEGWWWFTGKVLPRLYFDNNKYEDTYIEKPVPIWVDNVAGQLRPCYINFFLYSYYITDGLEGKWTKATLPTDLEAHDKQYWINCEGFNDGKNACTHCCKEIAQTIRIEVEKKLGKQLSDVFWDRVSKGKV